MQIMRPMPNNTWKRRSKHTSCKFARGLALESDHDWALFKLGPATTLGLVILPLLICCSSKKMPYTAPWHLGLLPQRLNPNETSRAASRGKPRE